MGVIIIKLIALIIIAIAVTFICDAKEIANKHFNKNENYSAVKILKLIGIVVAWIGMGILNILGT